MAERVMIEKPEAVILLNDTLIDKFGKNPSVFHCNENEGFLSVEKSALNEVEALRIKGFWNYSEQLEAVGDLIGRLPNLKEIDFTNRGLGLVFEEDKFITGEEFRKTLEVLKEKKIEHNLPVTEAKALSKINDNITVGKILYEKMRIVRDLSYNPQDSNDFIKNLNKAKNTKIINTKNGAFLYNEASVKAFCETFPNVKTIRVYNPLNIDKIPEINWSILKEKGITVFDANGKNASLKAEKFKGKTAIEESILSSSVFTSQQENDMCKSAFDKVRSDVSKELEKGTTTKSKAAVKSNEEKRV